MEASTKPVVLVVEDDDDIRNLIVRALAPTYTVHSAVDGTAALALLTTLPPPDAIVCDVMMPGIDGYALVRRYRAAPAWAQVPVLFLTARGQAADLAKGINAGARYYVVKPFKISDILAKVEKMVKTPLKR